MTEVRIRRWCNVALGLSLGITACADAEAPPTNEPLPVETITVDQSSTYSIARRFNGVVRSRRASRLGFERAGLVAKVYVDDGDRVRRGQLVAELDRSELLAARRRLQASLRESDAAVGLASLTADRLERLAEDKFTSKQSSDEASFALQGAEARSEGLRAAISEIDVDLRKSKLTAPFDGQVAARLVDEGTVVASGVPVVRFLESGGMEAVIGVPAVVARELPSGHESTLSIHSEEITVPVSRQIRDIDMGTRTVSLIYELPTADELNDGEVVTLIHRREAKSGGFWIPTTALTQGLRGLWSVYAVETENDITTLRREEVHVVHTETDRVYVRGTLEPGDRIVASGLHRVVAGQRVTVDAPLASAEGEQP
ncbi:MAG: efflux RND transporter periplasmic adaptor subunit [Myxococcota bacterium]